MYSKGIIIEIFPVCILDDVLYLFLNFVTCVWNGPADSENSSKWRYKTIPIETINAWLFYGPSLWIKDTKITLQSTCILFPEIR